MYAELAGVKLWFTDTGGTGVPIVLLTTESDAEKKQQAKAAGATGWITKPFQPEQLLSVTKKVLGQ